MNNKKKNARYLHYFEMFKKSNIVFFIHSKLNGNACKKWVFMIIPILCYAVNILLIVYAKAFWNNKIPLSYVKDLSNSLGLSVLYFISYFLSHHFPSLFDGLIKYGIDKNYINDIRMISSPIKNIYCCIIGIVLFVFGCFFGYSFCFQAMKNGNKIWINHLGKKTKIYYCILLGMTWYQSLSVLGMALMAGFVAFWCIKDKALIYIETDFNKNLSIAKCVDMLLCTFSYGLFYIVGSILFIINDKVSAQKPIKVINTFARNDSALFLIVSVLMLVIIAYIPLQELINFMRDKKNKLLLLYSREIASATSETEKGDLEDKRNDLINQPLILTSMTNKILIITSILIPLIGVIFQGMELY